MQTTCDQSIEYILNSKVHSLFKEPILSLKYDESSRHHHRHHRRHQSMMNQVVVYLFGCDCFLALGHIRPTLCRACFTLHCCGSGSAGVYHT